MKIIFMNGKRTLSPSGWQQATKFTRYFFYAVAITGTCFLTACQKQYPDQSANGDPMLSAAVAKTSDEVVQDYKGLSARTVWELQQARSATAKYLHLDKALADGYADINVVVPNMGYHFMKAALADSVFDLRKPEILVYNKNADGSFELVAVEYAVPIALSPDKAPEGFTGSADVWDRNETFGLWLQHAWIWAFNPDGVFNDTNPLIQVH